MVLGLAGLMVKVLGAVFRIPLGNLIGDDGMGYYQTAYPIYVLFLTIATAGIPTAVSRMVSERYALGQPNEAHRVFRLSSVLLFATGAMGAALLFFGAGTITEAILEPDAVYCMRAIAPALIFVPLMGSFRGFFQGRQTMGPTAVSQFVEQLFRVICGLTLSFYLIDYGLPYAAAGASFGATAGGIFGFIAIGIIYLRKKKEIDGELDGADTAPVESTRQILMTILTIAVPITIGASIMPIINSIDTAIVKNRLVSIGYDRDIARSLYGQLTGMAAPIINLPQVFTQGVSMSLVPVVAAAYKRGETDFMRENIALGLRYAMLISTPCAFGLMFLAKPIMMLLYPRQQASAVSAAGCLAVLALGVIFLSLVHASTGTLQGIGRQQIPVMNLCFGAAAKVCVTYVLTGIPALNVLGAAAGTASAYLVAALLNIRCVRKYTGTQIDLVMTVIKPVAASAVMGAGALGVYKLLLPVLGSSVSCIFAVGAGVVFYVLMVFLTKCITPDEIRSMPRGSSLIKVFTRLHLIR